MNAYKEMKERHQKEVNEFPFGFAFGDDQFVEMMKKWKLCHGYDGKPTITDCMEIVSIGAGGYVKKKDLKAMHDMFDRHSNEVEEAIKADKDGNGFVYDMFRYEMANHEYGYTGDAQETLEACGLDYSHLVRNPALLNGWNLAKEYLKDSFD